MAAHFLPLDADHTPALISELQTGNTRSTGMKAQTLWQLSLIQQLTWEESRLGLTCADAHESTASTHRAAQHVATMKARLLPHSGKWLTCLNASRPKSKCGCTSTQQQDSSFVSDSWGTCMCPIKLVGEPSGSPTSWVSGCEAALQPPATLCQSDSTAHHITAAPATV